MYKKLEAKLIESYTEGVTMEEAEKLAGEYLHAMSQISDALKQASLDARMRKAGLKSVKAAVYLEVVGKADKKPTEAQLTATLDTNELVSQEQDNLDKSEVDKEELDRQYEIAKIGHHHFKAISKGGFGA